MCDVTCIMHDVTYGMTSFNFGLQPAALPEPEPFGVSFRMSTGQRGPTLWRQGRPRTGVRSGCTPSANLNYSPFFLTKSKLN